MKEILAIILILYGISGLIQSFRKNDTENEILMAGRDPNSVQSSLKSVRIIGLISLGIGIYILY